ncbi:transcriptional protein SWT1-like [Oscarella lobularis]|uniref:transcriptional protein SWT1-like n=1 Tax=Oscarella lobularis TaxID=121494 RepID=UPI00331435AF
MQTMEKEDVPMDIDVASSDTIHQQIQCMRESLIESPVSAMEKTQTNAKPSNLCIVLDTNVLLAHLNFIVELRDGTRADASLVVPWIVLQELDGLKRNDHVGAQARKAIRFLRACADARHAHVLFQRPDEVPCGREAYEIQSNDDHILHCCIYFKGIQPDTILFTNDSALGLKAIVYHISTFSKSTILKGLENLSRDQNDDDYEAMECDEAPPSQKKSKARGHVPTPPSPNNLERKRKSLNRTPKSTIPFSNALPVLRDALSLCIREQMKTIYDEIWESIVVIKPPWTLRDCLQLLSRHWVAVFRFNVPEFVREAAESLATQLKETESRAPSENEVGKIIETGMKILGEFRKGSRGSYRDKLSRLISKLV